jgi:putative transposase
MVRKKQKDEFDNSCRVLICNIKNGSVNHRAAKRLTQIARRISNRANFLMRKDLFTGRKPNQSKVDKLLKNAKLNKSDKELYSRFPAAVSQRSIQIVGDNWKAFAAAKSDWKVNPSKYTSAPKPPQYVKHAKTVYIPCSSFFIKDDQIHFAKRLNLEPVPMEKNKFADQGYNPKASTKVVNEVRLVPTGSGFRFEVIYDKHRLSDFLSNNASSALFDKSSFISIDLGVNRFASLVSNKADVSPILINGGEMKRINQWYNKRCAELRSSKKYAHIPAVAAKRNRRIKEKLHVISRFVVNLCIKNDIGTVIVGKNHLWKNEINIGRKNNQNFASLPHSIFISMLKYKLREYGIRLLEQEESYTSKASYVDGDFIPIYEKPVEGEPKRKFKFSGTRVKRGLYKTKEGLMINADTNGAACISRKAGYEGVSLVSGGVVYTPTLVSL